MFILKVDQEIELQLLQLHHSEEIFRLVDHNRKHLRKWLPWVDNITSSFQYHPIITDWLKQFADNNGFNAAIRYNGKLVGMIGMHHIDWHNKQTSIGYYLGKAYQGKGIITRALRAVLNYIFFELYLNRVEIRCGVLNEKSRAIPERLGFKHEGTIRDGEFLYNHYHDLLIYGMLYREWLELNR